MTDWPDGHLANVLVPLSAPQYDTMVAKAQQYPGKLMFGRRVDARYFWRMEERGIWVPLEWLR